MANIWLEQCDIDEVLARHGEAVEPMTPEQYQSYMAGNVITLKSKRQYYALGQLADLLIHLERVTIKAALQVHKTA